MLDLVLRRGYVGGGLVGARMRGWHCRHAGLAKAGSCSCRGVCFCRHPPQISIAQMALPASFGVSDSGAATYNVAIVAPPGTAGVAPTLALNYNSQSGNGLLGMGWSLDGLPSVGRCPRTVTQDGVVGGINYDANDRFCIEGSAWSRSAAPMARMAPSIAPKSTASRGLSRTARRGPGPPGLRCAPRAAK